MYYNLFLLSILLWNIFRIFTKSFNFFTISLGILIDIPQTNTYN